MQVSGLLSNSNPHTISQKNNLALQTSELILHSLPSERIFLLKKDTENWVWNITTKGEKETDATSTSTALPLVSGTLK